MYELNGYGEGDQLNGLFKRLRKKLKRVVKSKIFKAALIIGGGVAAATFAGPLIAAKFAGGGAYKMIGKKMLSKGKKALIGKVTAKLGRSRKRPSVARGQAQAIRQARRLPQRQRERAIIYSKPVQYQAQKNAQAAMQPIFEEQYRRQYPPVRARRMAIRDSGVAAQETVKNLQQTAAPKTNMVPIIGAAAAVIISMKS